MEGTVTMTAEEWYQMRKKAEGYDKYRGYLTTEATHISSEEKEAFSITKAEEQEAEKRWLQAYGHAQEAAD